MCAIHQAFALAKPVNDGSLALANQIFGDYQEGCVLLASWGYDQTNINFYVVVKRTKAFVWLQEIEAEKTETGDMTGKCVPKIVGDNYVPVGKIIRRKLAIRDGKIIGCNFEPGYGWISVWDGKPESYSCYA